MRITYSIILFFFVDTDVQQSESSFSESSIVITIPTSDDSTSTSSLPTIPVTPITRNRRFPNNLNTTTPIKNRSSNVQKTKKLNPTWRKGNFSQNPEFIKFIDELSMPSCIREMTTPNEFFSYFFDDEMLNYIAEQSTLYSVQTNPEKPFKIYKSDIKKFLGIMSMMSIVHVPNTRKYWSENTANNVIRNCMSINMFENIRRYLHFNDNSQDLPRNNSDRDRLFKVRPLIDRLNEKFSSVPMEENISLDEQLCPTKVISYQKQYLPLKPHKWGYKLFVLCGVSGYGYNFEIYTGNENKESERLPNEPDFGATGNTVIRMSRKIPVNVHHKLFFDYYYTSLPVMVYLEKKGIHTVRTFRRNRFPNVLLTDEKQTMKKERGFSEECFTVIENIPITAVAWKDNKIVNASSTFVGEMEKSTVSRYDKKRKCVVPISRPKIIEVYNKHMGGVDLMDSMIGRYRIIMRSKKWYIKIFYHLIDMSMVNAWILFKRVTGSKMELSQFREQLAVELCQDSLEVRKRGRKSKESVENMMQDELKKRTKRTPIAALPSEEFRLDGYQHWPQFEKKKKSL